MKEHKLAAIVFTDIVGYTKRMEADEEGTMKLLARQREIIFPLVKDFGGEVIKEIGDGLLMMFTSANRAVRFAMRMQELLKDDELTIRAGIHIGDVIFEKGDVFGSAVNIAARIEPLAPAGGICISEDVRSQIRNQVDIKTSSIGKKQLKGVNQEIEIFRITNEEEESVPRLPFWQDLWQRRVIQILSLYIVGSYALRLLASFVVNEYMLSPHIISLVWWILVSLVPSIILVSYFHGRKGVTKWTRVELIGMPLNIVAALIILFVVFSGKDLGATTTTLTVENEDGEKIEKRIIKNEFRKRIMVFNMENKTEDSDLDYLQAGLSLLTTNDLSQDLFITPENMYNIYTRVVDAGYEDGTGIPISLMKRYSEVRNMNYFVFGEFTKTDNEFVLNAKVYDAQLSKLLSEIEVSDENMFSLVDKFSVEIKKAVGLPESHITETIDLPVEEIVTSSPKALEYFIASRKENALRNWKENVAFLNLAIQEDETFALAHVAATTATFSLGDMETAQKHLVSARNFQHRLTERNQFIAKYIYYVFQQQPDKAMTVVRMWVELYPDDISAHSTLAQRLALRNKHEEAIQEYKTILKIDPEQHTFIITLANYYMQLGKPDTALIYYNRYADLLPKQSRSYNNLGDYYTTIGDMKQARENYEKALMLAEPDQELSIQIDLANTEMYTGNYEEGYKQLNNALRIAADATDSSQVYSAIQDYYEFKGQHQKSLEAFEHFVDNLSRVLTPKDLMVFRIISAEPYINAGKSDEILRQFAQMKSELEPPLDKVVPIGEMMVYAELGDVEKTMEAIAITKELIKGFGEETLMANVYYSEARINEKTAKYEDAIMNYEKSLELNATSTFMYRNIARCYRHLGDYDKAEDMIMKAMKRNEYNPLTVYEAALLYEAAGDDDKYRMYLKRAVDIWQDADPDFETANEAKARLKEIV